MEDPILMSRLEALRNYLTVVSANLESKTWQSNRNSTSARAELLGESLWGGLEDLLAEIRLRLRELKQIEDDLLKAGVGDHAAVSAAWVRYAKTLGESQGLLRECLEIIGTLAIREKDLDHRILYVADELVRDCVTLSTGGSQYYLLVHGLSDTFSRTRARIIRLRFPEWTLWDLPLAAHELGHVVMSVILSKEREFEEELRTLTPFLAKQGLQLVTQDAELNQKNLAGGDSAVEAGAWASGRVRVLLADAFATYTMGPAYAYSAIMLRLSPSATAQRDRPSDAQRAQVILSMLDWMNSNSGAVADAYSGVIKQLETTWDSALERSNPQLRLTPELKRYVSQLAERFGGDVSEYAFSVTARYPATQSEQGWTRAREWAEHWLKQWKDGQPLSLPANQAGKLRDALNATWMCRANIDADATAGRDTKVRAHIALAKVGQELCTAIIETRTAGAFIRSGTAVTQEASR